jgi:hypothetical protein
VPESVAAAGAEPITERDWAGVSREVGNLLSAYASLELSFPDEEVVRDLAGGLRQLHNHLAAYPPEEGCSNRPYPVAGFLQQARAYRCLFEAVQKQKASVFRPLPPLALRPTYPGVSPQGPQPK